MVIVSADKDLLQLVGDGVWMLDTMRNGCSARRRPSEKLGVAPGAGARLPGAGRRQLGQRAGRAVGGAQDRRAAADAVRRSRRHLRAARRAQEEGVKAKLEEHTRRWRTSSRDLVTLKDDYELELDCGRSWRCRRPDERGCARCSWSSASRACVAAGRRRGDARRSGGCAPRARACTAEQRAAVARRASRRAARQQAARSGLGRSRAERRSRMREVMRDPTRSPSWRPIAGAERCALFARREGDESGGGRAGRAWRSRSAKRAVYVPLGARVPARCPRSCRAQALETRSARCSRTRRSRRSPATSSATRSCSPSSASRCGRGFDTMLASYLLDPERAATAWTTSLASSCDLAAPTPTRRCSARAGQASTRRAERRAPSAALGRRARDPARRRRAASLELRSGRLRRRCSQTWSCRSSRVLADMERTGVRVDTGAAARAVEDVDAELAQLEKQVLRAGRPRVQRRLAAAARDDPLRRARSCPSSRRRRPAARPTPTCSRSWPPMHELPRRSSSTASSPSSRAPTSTRCRAEVNPRTGRIHTDVRPGRRGDRAALVDRSEPAEHPDPHRARPRDPRRLRRRATATRSSPPTTRRSSCACSRI